MTKRFIFFTIFCCLIGLSLFAGVAYAAPSVEIEKSRNRVTIKESVTVEILAQIKKEIEDASEILFVLDKIESNEDLVKICEAFPAMQGLDISQPKELTSIAPVAKLKGLTRISMYGGTVADFSPLSDLTGLKTLEIRGYTGESGMLASDLKWMSKLTSLTSLHIAAGRGKVPNLVSFEGIPSLPNLTSARITFGAPEDLTPVQALSGLKTLSLEGSQIADLSPLTGLAKLEELSLSGVTVKDFSPLAGCPSLKNLRISGSKEADYSTLGKLAQVVTLETGYTIIDDISWISGMTNLKNLQVQNEKITDYSPLAKLQLESLRIWNMGAPVDLKQLSGVVSLKKLRFDNQKNVSGFEGLASLVNLQELYVSQMNAKEGTPVDMAFAKSLVNLKKLEMQYSEVSANFDAVANCVGLEEVVISNTTGIDNFQVLMKLPNLVKLQVPAATFTEAQLAGFANPDIKVTQR